MFAMNTSTKPPSLSIGNCGTTPRTPEIVNCLISMINPMDNYLAPSTTVVLHQHEQHDLIHHKTSQQTSSQLIKAGLKQSIESRRKILKKKCFYGNKDRILTNNSIMNIISEDEGEICKCQSLGLTVEDEDRRRHRRERNKMAATKCRMKKRERTINLVKEAEQLEVLNTDLKFQIQNLQTEQRNLFDMLKLHGDTCEYHISTNVYQSSVQEFLDDIVKCGLQQQQMNMGVLSSGNQVVNDYLSDVETDFVQQTQNFNALQSVSINTLSRNVNIRQEQEQQTKFLVEMQQHLSQTNQEINIHTYNINSTSNINGNNISYIKKSSVRINKDSINKIKDSNIFMKSISSVLSNNVCTQSPTSFICNSISPIPHIISCLLVYTMESIHDS